METNEQKVKAYDEVLGRVKDMHAHTANGYAKQIMEQIFLELKESEDERIRKMLIEFFSKGAENNSSTNGISDKDILAWLEKQGEPFDVNIITRDDEILQAISIGLTDAKEDLGWSDFGGLPIEEIQDWLEKQGEQKPVEWHREDEQNLNACLGFIPDEYLRRWLKDVIHVKYDKIADKVEQEYHCKGVREPKESTGVLKRLIDEQKSVWSEEDEVKINRIVAFLENLNLEKLKIVDDNNIFKKDVDWLKSLKIKIKGE